MIIIIGTRPDRKEQLQNCTSSISSEFPYITVDCDGYEIGKIKWALEHTNFDEFVFLQDSTEIKDNNLFNKLKNTRRSVSFNNCPSLFGSYLGKYKRSVLEQMTLPLIRDKLGSVDYECKFGREYAQIDPPLVLFPEFKDGDNFVEKWGNKKMMKIENKYLIKYKSIWCKEQL
jgi:hypothetical protein